MEYAPVISIARACETLARREEKKNKTRAAGKHGALRKGTHISHGKKKNSPSSCFCQKTRRIRHPRVYSSTRIEKRGRERRNRQINQLCVGGGAGALLATLAIPRSRGLWPFPLLAPRGTHALICSLLLLFLAPLKFSLFFFFYLSDHRVLRGKESRQVYIGF